MKRSSSLHLRGMTVVEVMVAAAVLALVTIAMTESMLILNRYSSISRMRNLAKAMVLGKIQEASAVAYDPTGTPPVIPANLQTGSTATNTTLGDASTELGTVPATLTYVVANTGNSSILSVKCSLKYTYLGRPQNYEIDTYRAPD